MSIYDPKENVNRLRQGLTSLMVGRSQQFSTDDALLVVVFDGEATLAAASRLLLFQQFFFERLGFVPEYVKTLPHCIKVHFSVGSDPEDQEAIRKLLVTDGFERMCERLRISQVQFGAQMYRPKPHKR